MLSWLTAELVRVRGFSLKRHHALAVLLIIVAVVLVFALGVFVGYQYPYRTVAPPKVPPTETVPHCGHNPKQHDLGSCLPQTKIQNQASITATNQGSDFSDNNPVYSSSAWDQIAKHNAFVILKASEGTGFADPTAQAMSKLARERGLVVAGYDFLHPCQVSATAEADLFAGRLKTDVLIGPHTLPPVGDAEYAGTGCNVRTWITDWAARVHTLTGRHPTIYTGAWWWDPHVGSWWLSGALAWISGYVPWSALRPPAGRQRVDLWQFTDHGWNGATTSDLSVWRDGARAFNAATGAPVVRRINYTVFPLKPVRLYGHPVSERLTVQAWDRQKCRNPVRRSYCRVLHKRLLELRGRIDWVAHHPLYHGKTTYFRFHRGERRTRINRRINHR